MNTNLYNAKNCPCPSDCKRHGICKDCIAFHHARHEQTYCEFADAKLAQPEGAVKSGRELRLLDYGPCAG